MESMYVPEFDIVLLTHGHMEMTIKCVKALFAHTEAPFHLIVMDDSTPDMDDGTDLTPTWFARFHNTHTNVTFIHSDTPFTSGIALFKQSLEYCETPYVSIVVNSAEVEPGWDIAALNFIKMQPKAGIVGLKVIHHRTGQIESAGIGTAVDGVTLIDIAKGQPSHQSSMIYECDAVEGALILARKKALQQSLDGDFYHGWAGCEDIEMCMAARRNGWKIYFCGMGVAYHRTAITRFAKNDNDILNNYENKEIFAKRWGLWSPSLKINPLTRELRPDVKERPTYRLPPVLTVTFKGEIVRVESEQAYSTVH